MNERPLPKIHVMPVEYSTAVPLSRAHITARAWLIIGVSGLFIIVVGSAAWYFTTTLRQQPQAPQPVVVVEAPPVTPTPIAPEPSTPQPSTETPTAPIELPQIQPWSDTDADGLTNAEEEIFHTQNGNPDSDNDGYLDGHEAINLYNPAGFQPERLLDAGLVRQYVDTPAGLSFFYPAEWSVVAQDATGKELVITAPSGDVMTVTVVDNPSSQRIEDWYAIQNPGGVLPGTIQAKSGAVGLFAADGRTAFFAQGNSIVVLAYKPSGTTGAAPEHPRVFEIIAVSLVFLAP